jgi:hypothetical protein
MLAELAIAEPAAFHAKIWVFERYLERKRALEYSFLDCHSNSRKENAFLVFSRLTGREALLHDFKFEVEFLAAKNRRQIELPEFSREPKRGPALIEVD